MFTRHGFNELEYQPTPECEVRYALSERSRQYAHDLRTAPCNAKRMYWRCRLNSVLHAIEVVAGRGYYRDKLLDVRRIING